MWGRPGDSNLQEEKEHGSRWFVFTRRLKAFSSAHRLSFFATFSGKAPKIGKCRAGHLKAQVSPKKLFPKLALQRRLEHPGRERCKLPPGPGGGGGSVCALARGPGGGHGCSARAACPLRARPGPADRWTRRESVGPSARQLAALGVLCGLRAASCGCSGFLFAARLEGGPFFFFFSFLRVYVCVCAQSISIWGMKNGRWRPEGSPREAAGEAAGARGGRRAAPGCRRRSCHPFSCSGLYKGEGRVREVGGDSLSSSGPESAPGGGGGSWGRAWGQGGALRGSLRAEQPLSP